MTPILSVDTRGFETALDALGRDQLPYATAVALTRTAQKVKLAIRATMQVGFDRPTPFSLNSVYLSPATLSAYGGKVQPPQVPPILRG